MSIWHEGETVSVRRRQDYIYKRAYELATSGLHISPITIVSALVNEGYPEAAELLNSEIIRSDLRQACTLHWKQSGPAEEDSPETPPMKPDRAKRPVGRESPAQDKK